MYWVDNVILAGHKRRNVDRLQILRNLNKESKRSTVPVGNQVAHIQHSPMATAGYGAVPGRGSRDDGEVKGSGIHYTPVELADFLARRIVAQLDLSQSELTVLDPACGDGQLLAAIARACEPRATTLTLTGVDRDELAVECARATLAEGRAHSIELLAADFLTLALDQDAPSASVLDGRQFDAIISNPPYVRTQVLGASSARELAERFDLSGRVDLYQAFVRAMTPHLRPGGVLGLLCSNRFLTVQAGMALRDFLSSEFELCEVFDLGDTKLFAAAVLPAIVIARRREGGATSLCPFTRIYESSGCHSVGVTESSSVVTALEEGLDGMIAVNGRCFEIERGKLQRHASAKEPWRITHDERERWLATVADRTELTFAEVGNIRVGIKTTADSVFIRDRWDDLPSEICPESELLHPLLTHHVAARWRALGGLTKRKSVLYPHIVSDGKRRAIDLESFPRARAYLESHRATLAGRAYVLKAGRAWYEIWVPQQPSDWRKPKLVFPDISEAPRFFLDTSGAVVNGDCYWMSLENDVNPEFASLLLAVANSSFAVAFYDAVCGNRLYAGRRRFITQYVKRFPIPRIDATTARALHELVERLRDLPESEEEVRERLEAEVDALVWQGFGLREEVRG